MINVFCFYDVVELNCRKYDEIVFEVLVIYFIYSEMSHILHKTFN